MREAEGLSKEAGGNLRFLSFSSGAFPQTAGINDNSDIVGCYYAFADTNSSEPRHRRRRV